MPGVDEHAEELYGLPADRFVAERDARAKALRKDGDKETAAAVKALPRPTVAAAAVNAAVRADPKAARALAESARVLADAQTELLAGGDATALREAAGRARAAIDALLAASEAEGATADKVRGTLHAASVDPDVLAEVSAGRVVREHAASGFGGLDALAAAPPARRTAAKPKRDDGRRKEKLRRAKEAEAAAEQDLAAARAALEQVEAALDARRRAVRDAEARLKDAVRRRERAES